MKTVERFLSRTPEKFIPVPGCTCRREISAWSAWWRCTAAHRFLRCFGTRPTSAANAANALLRAYVEDRALALMPCMVTCSVKILHAFTVPPRRRRFAIALCRPYLLRKWQSRNRKELNNNNKEQRAGGYRAPLG